MEDANGQPLSLGSGFLVRDGEIASNLHIIEGASQGYVKFIGEKAKHNIQGFTGIDADRDLVLLKIPPIRIPPLLLGNSDEVEVGEPVYAVGNPLGFSGIRQIGSDKLLQITAPISPGSSGGPILNSKGEVIGVSVGTFSEGQNLNFAIPSNYLKVLIAKAGPPKPLIAVKPSNKQRSILKDLGGLGTEGVTAYQFSWKYEKPFFYYYDYGDYMFFLRNKLRHDIKNVRIRVVFYDSEGNPIDFDEVRYRGVIPAGLGKIIEGNVKYYIRELTTPTGSLKPNTRVELRILDFQLVE